MAITRVSGGTGSDISNTSWTLTFGFTASAGNLLVLCGTSSPNPMSTPSGYTLAVSSGGGTPPYVYVWYKVAAGGETSATISIPSGSSYSVVHAIQFSGLATSTPFDKSASGGGTNNTTAESGTTATLSQSDELVIAAYSETGYSYSFTQASGFTSNALTRDSFDNITLQSSYKVVSAISAITADGTWQFAGYDANVIATFKAASVAGSLPVQQARRPIPVQRASLR